MFLKIEKELLKTQFINIECRFLYVEKQILIITLMSKPVSKFLHRLTLNFVIYEDKTCFAKVSL